jgi:RimJ/RimL family protein N-acetyltransferase
LGRAALSFGFDELDVPQVFAVVRPSCRASINVLKKIDMRRIDTLDRCARTGDEFCVLGQS